MATCNISELIAANPCFATLPDYQLEVIITQLLCNLLAKIQSGGEVTCDVDTLLEQGACFNNMPVFTLKVLQAQLLCEISNAL